MLIGTSVLSNDLGTGLTIDSFSDDSTLGTVSMNLDGTYTYTPPSGFSGSDTFTYIAIDSVGQLTTEATVVITVLPVVVNDEEETPAETVLFGTSVLTNDLGTNLTVDSFSDDSTLGTVSVNSDGTYTYTPPSGFSGIDSFTYVAKDSAGQLTDEATVDIKVLPVAVNDEGETVAETVLIGASVLTNDLGTNLTVDIDSSDTTSFEGGTVLMNSNGTYEYTPPSGFSGIDSFTYIAIDALGQTSNEATVNVTVLPIAINNSNSTNMNTQLVSTTSLLVDDIGTDLVVSSFDSTSMEGGIVNVQANGFYTYTPANNFVGIDTFNYTITDSAENSSSATVTINVLNVVPPPPTDFIGVTKKCRFINKTTSTLTATWKAPADTIIQFYRIYYENALIEEISGDILEYFTQINSSKDAVNYEISVVNNFNIESERVTIRVLND